MGRVNMSFLTTNPAYFLMDIPPELDFLKDLRWILVSTLYALVLAEIAHQSVSLVGREHGGWRDLSTGISHLLLLAGLVTTSWVGWSAAIVREEHAEHRLESIFSLPYLLLLLDIGLLTAYFIFAKEAGIPKAKSAEIKPSAKPESFWLMVVFGGYVLWDIVTYVFQEEKGWAPIYPTIFCFGLSILAWFAFKRVTLREAVVVADFGMLALIFLFRALKAPRIEERCYLYILIGGLGAVFLFCLVLARLLNRKAPN
jgi:FtsH-binding integral membrane protein